MNNDLYQSIQAINRLIVIGYVIFVLAVSIHLFVKMVSVLRMPY
jgi:hypothetical protein